MSERAWIIYFTSNCYFCKFLLIGVGISMLKRRSYHLLDYPISLGFPHLPAVHTHFRVGVNFFKVKISS